MLAPADSVVTANSTVLLTCVVHGFPLPPTISWSFENSTLSNSSTDSYIITIQQTVFEVGGVEFLQSILEICGVEVGLAGYYACSAENSAGNDTESFTLEVQPQGTYIVSYCRFKCSSIHMYSRYCTSILYAKTCLKVSNVGVLHTVHIQYRSVSAKCVCVCTPTIISFCPAPPEILIAPSEVVSVDEGNTILLTCVALGPPRPSIYWSHSGTGTVYGPGAGDDRHRVNETVGSEDGVEFVTSVFEICGIEFGEAGEYSCMAGNSAGVSSVSFNITVEDPTGV